MHYAILFQDDPNADPDIRRRHMAEHLAFLEAHADEISVAGPLATIAGDSAGGLWIVQAKNDAAAERLVHADPFWPTGLRKSVDILRWMRVYADGSRLIDPK